MSTKLKDIAEITGVSITSVSKVLNNKPIRITPAKRKEIQAAAIRLNYKVNLAARTLVTKRSNLLGLIVPDIENAYFSRLAKNLQKISLENNNVLLILNSDERLKSDLLLLDLLISRQVDGIFICPSYESFQTAELRKKLQGISIPLIMVDRVYQDSGLCSVSFDNTSGAYEAVSLLIQKGHRKIAIIAPPENENTVYSRLGGYQKALADHLLPLDASYVFHGDYSYDSGYAAGMEILQTDATAVFSCNDMMTLGFLKALRETKKKIPGDISVISNDNISTDYTFGVPITTVIQNVALLARESFQSFQSLVDTGTISEKILKPILIERDSIMSMQASTEKPLIEEESKEEGSEEKA